MVAGVGFALFNKDRLEKMSQYHRTTSETSFLKKYRPSWENGFPPALQSPKRLEREQKNVCPGDEFWE